MRAGVHVVPEERDGDFVGVDMKEQAVEQQACADAASVAARYFLTSSKWNQQLSTADCVLRLTQLQHNFDRTEARDAVKIFDREKEQEVVTVIRQRKGCALLPLAESAAVMPKALKVRSSLLPPPSSLLAPACAAALGCPETECVSIVH